jgi:hypothetical protein
MEREERFIEVYLCSSVEKICPDFFFYVLDSLV